MKTYSYLTFFVHFKQRVRDSIFLISSFCIQNYIQVFPKVKMLNMWNITFSCKKPWVTHYSMNKHTIFTGISPAFGMFLELVVLCCLIFLIRPAYQNYRGENLLSCILRSMCTFFIPQQNVKNKTTGAVSTMLFNVLKCSLEYIYITRSKLQTLD